MRDRPEGSGPGNRLVDRLDRLIEKGNKVLSTKTTPPAGAFAGYSVESQAFTEWRAQSSHLLGSLLGPDAVYVRRFETDVTEPVRMSSGIGPSVMA